jgi:hypothetical protein
MKALGHQHTPLPPPLLLLMLAQEMGTLYS